MAVFETNIPPLENDPYTDVYLGSDNIRPGMYTHTGEAVFDELKFWDWVLPDGQIQLAMIPGSGEPWGIFLSITCSNCGKVYFI